MGFASSSSRMSSSLHRARALLKLDHEGNLTKEVIQKAYFRAAKSCHPDCHSNPNAELFRSCHDARHLLLLHYCGVKDRTPFVGIQKPAPPPQHKSPQRRTFVFGIPKPTFEEKLAFHGFALVLVSLKAFYVWLQDRRRENKRFEDD